MTVGFYAALFYQKRHLSSADLIVLEAVYFILLQLALVVGLALFFSCLSTPILSAVFTFCLYVIGNLSADIRWFGQETGSAVIERLTTVLYYLLPNFGDFNVIAQVAHGEKIASYVLVSNSLYALLYGTILVSASILAFEEREFR
jgi:hypothetical protein